MDNSESTYTIEELARNAGLFHTKYECVKAALLIYGEAEITVSKAKEIVENFMKTEVV